MHSLKQLSPIQALGFVIILSIPYYFGLGAVHLFDWDEVNFAECAREMIVSGDYTTVQIGFEPFWEKPPLFIWLQVLCMKIFGVGEFAARLPSALCGTATLLTIFSIGTKLKNHTFGLLWALVYTGSLLPHFYFKFGIIDPVFNLFIFLSLYQTILTVEERNFNRKRSLLAGLFSGLAVLTKGPVGLLLLLLTFGAYMAITRFKRLPKIKAFGWFAVSFTLIVCSWFAINIMANGWSLFWQFINYQVELFTKPVAGHNQPFYYHFVVVFFGCFPMSFLALPAFRSAVFTTRTPYNFRMWMLCLFWVVMILFSIVTTKIVHYSSMCYLPLAFLAAAYLYKLEEKHRNINKWLNIATLCMGTLIGLALMALPFALHFRSYWLHWVKDEFSRTALMQDIGWPYWIAGAGVFIIAVSIRNFIIRKKGVIIEAVAVKAFNTSMVMVTLFMVILPRIEHYTQGPAIDFMIAKARQKAHVVTYGYKSYAIYLYAQYPPGSNINLDDANYLLNNNVDDKRVYLIAKCTDKDLPTNPKVKLIKEQGGFKFYEKIKEKN